MERTSRLGDRKYFGVSLKIPFKEQNYQKDSYELDHPAVLAIAKCLSDDKPKIRNHAIHILYQMLGDKSLELIINHLYDPDISVKKTAILWLSLNKNPEVLEYLMEALEKEEDKATLVEMVRALQEITGNLLTKDEWMQWWTENKETYLKTKE